MARTFDLYEKLVVEEEELLERIKFCEGCQWALLEYVCRHGELGEALGEEILTDIHQIEQDLRTELLHLRLEKGVLAERMKRDHAPMQEPDSDEENTLP